MKKNFLEIRKLSFTIAIVSLFIACGSGGGGSSSSSSESTTEKISKREHVLINYHYPKDICDSSYLKEELKSVGAKDIITLVVNKDVACENYGKVHDGRECYTQDLNYYNEPTCVVGLNRSIQKVYNSKMTSDILFLEDVKDIVVSIF